MNYKKITVFGSACFPMITDSFKKTMQFYQTFEMWLYTIGHVHYGFLKVEGSPTRIPRIGEFRKFP